MGERERLVILSAGKATRLDGRNKLLVEAGGMPVLDWHKRSAGNLITDIVVRSTDWPEVNQAAEHWVSGVVTHDGVDGPAGALRHYVSHRFHDGPLTVIFADTLVPSIPENAGSWVGVAPNPGRVWDYQHDWTWVRGVPGGNVCVGLYRFENTTALRQVLSDIPNYGQETPMIDVLNEYEKIYHMRSVKIDGWQDAGDFSAIARVRGL